MSSLADLRREYASRALTEADAHEDPIQQFSLWFGEALKSELINTNAMSLATATHTGERHRVGVEQFRFQRLAKAQRELLNEKCHVHVRFRSRPGWYSRRRSASGAAVVASAAVTSRRRTARPRIRGTVCIG